jgi:hypothetical protein
VLALWRELGLEKQTLVHHVVVLWYRPMVPCLIPVLSFEALNVAYWHGTVARLLAHLCNECILDFTS